MKRKQTRSEKRPKPVKVGHVEIKIYHSVRKNGYEQFMVPDYTGDKQRVHTFATLKKARAKAGEIARALRKGQLETLSLADKDKASYVRALELLKPTGVALEVAAAIFAEAFKVLEGNRILESAKDYARRYPLKRVVKTVPEVFAEMMQAKQGLSETYKADLEYRVGAFANAFQKPLSEVTQEAVREFLEELDVSDRSHDNFVRLKLLCHDEHD